MRSCRCYSLIFLCMFFFVAPTAQSTPLGFGLFCLTYSDSIDCNAQSGRIGTLEEIAQVKSRVDYRFTARNDYLDDWNLLNSENRHGDCEDFALTYRRWLLEKGWPSSALRLATGSYRGTGHAVLLVTIGRATYVLDIQSSRPVPIEDYQMRWWEIQSASDPVVWN